MRQGKISRKPRLWNPFCLKTSRGNHLCELRLVALMFNKIGVTSQTILVIVAPKDQPTHGVRANLGKYTNVQLLQESWTHQGKMSCP